MAEKAHRFKTPYNSRPSMPEQHGGVSKTETAGYVPPKKIIENMITAGMRLKAFRQENYDLAEGEDDVDFDDPTRTPGFDMADASQLQLELQARKKALKAEGSNTSQVDKSDPGASSKEVKGADKVPADS